MRARSGARAVGQGRAATRERVPPVVVDARLRAEAERFALRFACPDCASYDPERRACSMGYPVSPHESPRLEGRESLVWCQMFELG